MQARHVTIDGSLVDLRAPASRPASEPSSVGVFTVKGVWQEFTASYREFGRDVARDMGVKLTESYAYRGGTLGLGTRTFSERLKDGTRQNDIYHLAVWEGRKFSVHTHLYNGSRRDLIPIFDEFRILEGPRGIQLVPRTPKHTKLVKEPTLLQEIPRVGLLLIEPLTRPMARNLPKWGGTPTVGGQLYAARRPDNLHFVLVGQRSHTTILPDGEECEKDDLKSMAALEISWQPGPMLAKAM